MLRELNFIYFSHFRKMIIVGGSGGHLEMYGA